jgi:hypothetical protein
MDKCGHAAWHVYRLIQGTHHEACDQFVAAMGGFVTMCPVPAVLRHEPLVGEPAQYRHDGGVRQLAGCRNSRLHLPHGLRPRSRQEMFHHSALEVAHRANVPTACGLSLTHAVDRPGEMINHSIDN